MITDKDIKKLTDAFATRKEFQSADTKILDEVFAVRKDLKDLEERMDQKFDKVLTSIDNLAKLLSDYHQEMKMLSAKVDRHEKWILQIAEKLELKLKT